jgi:hypothetical protein
LVALVLSEDFLTFSAGPVDPVFDFGDGFTDAGLETFFEAGFALLLPAALAVVFGLALFGAALEVSDAFLLLGSAFREAFGEAFFGATVAFATLTSRYCLDFGNY